MVKKGVNLRGRVGVIWPRQPAAAGVVWGGRGSWASASLALSPPPPPPPPPPPLLLLRAASPPFHRERERERGGGRERETGCTRGRGSSSPPQVGGGRLVLSSRRLTLLTAPGLGPEAHPLTLSRAWSSPPILSTSHSSGPPRPSSAPSHAPGPLRPSSHPLTRLVLEALPHPRWGAPGLLSRRPASHPHHAL